MAHRITFFSDCFCFLFDILLLFCLILRLWNFVDVENKVEGVCLKCVALVEQEGDGSGAA